MHKALLHKVMVSKRRPLHILYLLQKIQRLYVFLQVDSGVVVFPILILCPYLSLIQDNVKTPQEMPLPMVLRESFYLSSLSKNSILLFLDFFPSPLEGQHLELRVHEQPPALCLLALWTLNIDRLHRWRWRPY